MKKTYTKSIATAILGSAALLSSLEADVNFRIEYTEVAEGTYRDDQEATTGGINNSGVDEELAGLVEQVINDYADVLIDYRDPNNAPDEVVIRVSAGNLDPQSNTLAFAAPIDTVRTGDFLVASEGIVHINSRFDNQSEQDLIDTIFHEFGHVVGIGSLWVENGLIDENGQFIGEMGLDKFQRDFAPDATVVPIEDAGGAGTAGGHWDEGTNLTGINPNSPYFGRPFDEEIMTGIASLSNFLSDVTIGAFFDLGYEVNFLVGGGPFYWDAGNPNNDNAITSADGIWNLTNTNWADDEDGAENVAYVDQSLVVFGDKGSVVTIEGSVNPSALRFDVTGYTITGGELSAEGNTEIIVANEGDIATLDTVVNNGRLSVTGPGRLNNLGTINSNLAINEDAIFDNTGSVTGNATITGSVTNNGAGVFSGDITINTMGSFASDDGGIADAGDITNAGIITISGNHTAASYTSNSASLEGSGTLTASTYTINDGSTVNANLGAGAVTTAGTVTIAGNLGGSLTVNSGTTTTGGTIAGNVAIAESAALVINAATVAEAPNALNALERLSSSSVIANAGSLTLNGSQSVSSYTGSSTSVVKGSGVLTVTNGFSGGRIETTATSIGNLGFSINANGSAVKLGAGTTLKFETGNVAILPFAQFNLIDNASEITGDSTSIGFENFDLTGLDASVNAVFDVSSGNIIILASNTEGSTKNTSAVATALVGGDITERFSNVNGLGSDNPEINAIIQSLSVAGVNAQAQLQELSPETYGSVADYSIRQQLSVVNAARHAQYTVRSGQYRFFGGFNNLDATSESSLDNGDYTIDGNSGYAGISRRFSGSTVVGIFGAVNDGEITSTSKNLNLEAKGTSFGIFSETALDMPWGRSIGYGLLTTSLSFGQYEYDGTRIAQGVTNDVDGIDSNVFQAGIGYKAALWDTDGGKISPYIGADYIKSDTDRFVETNGANSLAVSSFAKEQLLLTAGVDGVWYPSKNGRFGFTGKVEFQHDAMSDDTDINANFVNGGNAFTVTSPGISSSTVEGRLGLFFKVGESATVRGSVFSIVGDDLDEATGANIGFDFEW